MKFTHSSELFSLYPQNYCGLLRIECANWKAIPNPVDVKFQDDPITAINRDLVSSRVKSWQEIFGKMGADISQKHSSLEYLFTRWQENGRIGAKYKFVELYNWYSLYRAVPMGAYNVANISGDLVLGLNSQERKFTPLGGAEEIVPAGTNEVMYFDDEKVTCRLWNNKDCDQTVIINKLKDILLMFDIVAADAGEAQKLFDQYTADWKSIPGVQVLDSVLTGPSLASEVNIG